MLLLWWSLLRLGEELVTAFHTINFEIGIETKGIRIPLLGIDRNLRQA
jgi:hypothetical protein